VPAVDDARPACLSIDRHRVDLAEADAVDEIEALVRSLPASAGQIRRRFWRDPEFREVCEDYRDILEALARLEATPASDAAWAEEYRQLAAELLAEAVEMLKGESPRC
jgi:hypothetical protein